MDMSRLGQLLRDEICVNLFNNGLNGKYEKIYGDNVFSSPQGATLLDNLKVQIVSRLIDEGIFLQEINRSGYDIDTGTVEREMQRMIEKSGKSEDALRNELEEAGYGYEYFKENFSIRVLIGNYLDDRVLAGASSDFEKQKLFASWYTNAKTLAEVVYYDKILKDLIQNQSGGASCCASN